MSDKMFYMCKSIMEEADKWNLHQINDKEFLENVKYIMEDYPRVMIPEPVEID